MVKGKRELIKKRYGKVLLELSKFLKWVVKYKILSLKDINVDRIIETKHFFEDTTYVNENIVKDADLIIDGNYNIFGKKVHLGRNKWNKDFNTGYTWTNKYYKFFKIGLKSNNSDVKIPWELSRLQHIISVGRAYRITKDEKYSLYFIEHFNDWNKHNKYMNSINWKCAMEVAIRAVNLIIGLELFSDSKLLDKKFVKRVNNSLFLHGRFIFENIEKYDNTGNHYISDLVGLLWLSVYFDKINNKEIIRWREFAIKELNEELLIQFNPDGTNYETSISYQRFVVEMIVYTLVYCEKNEILILQDEAMERLEKACDFIVDIIDVNGRIKLIGDNDSGRVIIISNYYDYITTDLRLLFMLLGEYFNRNDYKKIGEVYKNEIRAIITNTRYKNGIAKELRKGKYNDGGYYILRNNTFNSIIRCGELAFHGHGTHSHNDQLSITLDVLGEEIFIDPGSYVYTSNWELRNKFRSTSMHNTLQIEEYEQNTIDPNKLFVLKEETFSECIEFCDEKFIGQHVGYVDKVGAIHRRSIQINNSDMEIIDELIGNKNNYKSKIYFILNKECNVVSSADNLICINKNNVEVIIDTNGKSFEVILEKFSPEYGVIENTYKIIIYNDNIINKVKISAKFISDFS